jgi:hypothetical protein
MKLSTYIKQLLYPLYIFPRTTSVQKQRLRYIFDYYHQSAAAGMPVDHKERPLKLFSNLEEDGILLWIMGTLGIRQGYFIDIGSNDCINSNCANLALNFKWNGFFIDCEKRLLNIGKRNYRIFRKNSRDHLKFIQSFVTPETINRLIEGNNNSREIDLISIDIDGNDFAIFQALAVVQPKCFVIENKIEFGRHDIVIPPVKANREAGASITAFTRLAAAKGYRLVATNSAGFNCFYLREDLVSNLLPEISLDNIINDPAINKDFYNDKRMQELMGQVNITGV